MRMCNTIGMEVFLSSRVITVFSSSFTKIEASLGISFSRCEVQERSAACWSTRKDQGEGEASRPVCRPDPLARSTRIPSDALLPISDTINGIEVCV